MEQSFDLFSFLPTWVSSFSKYVSCLSSLRCLNFHLDGSTIHMFLSPANEKYSQISFFSLFLLFMGVSRWASWIDEHHIEKQRGQYLFTSHREDTWSLFYGTTNTKVLPHALSLELLLTKSEVSQQIYSFPKPLLRTWAELFAWFLTAKLSRCKTMCDSIPKTFGADWKILGHSTNWFTANRWRFSLSSCWVSVFSLPGADFVY